MASSADVAQAGLKAFNTRDSVESFMSLVTIKLLEGMYSAAQKQQMIEQVTAAMVAVQGERMRPVIWVLIEDDIRSGSWGIAGQGLTAERLQGITAEGVSGSD